MKQLIALFCCFLIVACAGDGDGGSRVTAKVAPMDAENARKVADEQRLREEAETQCKDIEELAQKEACVTAALEKGRETAREAAVQALGEGGVGFHSLENAAIPEAIREAAKSVFEVRIVVGSSAGHNKKTDVSESTREQVYKAIDDLKVEEYDARDKQILKLQVDHCVKLKQTGCPLQFQVRAGSGFLLGSGVQLAMTAHQLEYFIKGVELTEKKSLEDVLSGGVDLKIFLFDHSGQLVFNGLEDKAMVVTRPLKSAVTEITKKYYAQDSDMVIVQLSKSIGNGLKARQGLPVVAEKVFVLGYPSCTGCAVPPGMADSADDFFDRGEGLNAEGGLLKVSFGPIRSFDDAAQILALPSEMKAAFDRKQMVFYEADSHHGASGGVVLSESGEVLAVHSGGKSVKDGEKTRRISRGVRSPNWK